MKKSTQLLEAIELLNKAKALVDSAMSETENEEAYKGYVRPLFDEIIYGRDYGFSLDGFITAQLEDEVESPASLS